MSSRCLLLVISTLLLTAVADEQARAAHFRRASRSSGPWHTEYYSPAAGAPVALVVPPTARTQTHLRAGAPSSRVTRIGSQYLPIGPQGGVYDKRAFQPTPQWPISTDQLGVNYVLGPR